MVPTLTTVVIAVTVLLLVGGFVILLKRLFVPVPSGFALVDLRRSHG